MNARPATLAALMLCLPFVPAPAAAQRAAAAPEEHASIEDVEIMRRLLVQAVQGELDRRPRPAGTAADAPAYLAALSTQLALARSGPVTHSAGFRAPGGGALFTLDVAVPVRGVEPRDEGGAGADPEDAWEAARRALRGGEAPAASEASRARRYGAPFVDSVLHARVRRFVLDPEAIDAVRDALLRTLARHGARIEGLGRNAAVTVAVRFSARTGLAADNLYVPLVLDAVRGEEGQADWSSWYRQYAHAAAPDQRLVVQLPAAELADLAARAPGVDEIARRAEVIRY